MQPTKIALAAALFVTLVSTPSFASTYSTDGVAQIVRLGNTENYPSDFDKLTLLGASNSNFTPGWNLLNTVAFEVNYNAWTVHDQTSATPPNTPITEYLTIDGVPGSITIPWAIHIDYNQDTITLGAASAHIGNWWVFLDATPFTQPIGSGTFDLNAQFVYRADLGGIGSTPLPGAIVLMGTGLVGLGLFARRRRRTSSI